jgi:hypothetical protein
MADWGKDDPSSSESSWGSDDPVSVSPHHIPGRAESALRGALQSATFGFGDELTGLYAAGKTGGWSDYLPAPVQMTRGIYRYLQNNPEARKAYTDQVEKQRALNEAASQQHGGMYLGGELGGALAIPAGAAAKGTTMLSRMGLGALTGAGYGALTGIGSGRTPEERESGAVSGLVTGALTGGFAPPVIESAAGLVGKFLPRNVENEATAKVVSAIKANQAAKTPEGLTPAELAATPEARLIDVAGQHGRTLAQSAANVSPEAESTLKQALQPRIEGQFGRVYDWLKSNLNFPENWQTTEALDKAQSGANLAAYQRAYKAGVAPIWSPELEAFTTAPAVQDAARKVNLNLANKQVAKGIPINNPLIYDKSVSGGQFVPSPGGAPDLQYWDLIKRQLDKGGYESQQLSKALREHLDTIVPEYGIARKGAAGGFAAENAHEAGQKFVTDNTMEVGEAQKKFAAMTPAQQKLFQDGFLARYTDILKNNPDRFDLLNKINQTPKAQEKLQMVLGNKYKEFEAMLHVENVMQKAQGSIKGYSTTARQLIHSAMASGAGGAAVGAGGELIGSGDWRHPLAPQTYGRILAAALTGAAASRGARVNQQVAERVAQMLTSRDPQVLSRGAKVVAGNEKMMDALRQASTRVGRIGGITGGRWPEQ